MVNLKRYNKYLAKQEEGMALAITLVMGLLLVVGASSLVARMVMGRKLGAAGADDLIWAAERVRLMNGRCTVP